MFDFIFNEANLPFSISIGLMFFIGLLEILMSIGGLGLTNLVDSLTPDSWGVELDIPDVDAGLEIDAGGDLASGGGASLLHTALGFFGIGKVPLLVVIVSFLTSFGLAGYFLQAAVNGIAGIYLPASLASVPAVVGGAFITGRLSALIGRILPDVETEAVDSGTFVGRTAVLTLGEARKGAPAQGKLKDHNDQTHYVMIEPDQEDVVFREADQVLLIGRKGSVFQAIAVTSDALIRE